MINVKELRIGNWLIDGHGEYYQVEVADLALLSTRPDTKECNPIPLTPEVLEACGFKKDGFNQYGIELPKTLSCATRKLYFAGDYLYLEERVESGKVTDLIAIWNKDLMKEFYLHVLMNLYHSLTGKGIVFVN